MRGGQWGVVKGDREVRRRERVGAGEVLDSFPEFMCVDFVIPVFIECLLPKFGSVGTN